MSEETIFDGIIAGRIPADVVFEDEYVLAFKDINPQAPVHVLVIPKKKVKNIGEFRRSESQDAAGYLQSIGKVAEHLGLEADGYRVVFNTGRLGQQTVDYVHAHILAGCQMSWPPGSTPPQG